MQISYDEWYERTVAILLSSDIPRAFLEDYLTNRPAMRKLYQDGFAAAEVLMHISKAYRLQKEAEAQVAAKEARRRDVEAGWRKLAAAEEERRRGEALSAQRRSKLENLRRDHRHVRYWALRINLDLDKPGDRIGFTIMAVTLLVGFVIALALVVPMVLGFR